MLLTPSSADIAQFVDQDTEGLIFAPSGVDTAQFVDNATDVVNLIPSSNDIAQFVDQDTESFLLIPTTTAEEHTTYDAATTSLLLVPSSTDTADYVDSNTKSLLLVPSSTDKGLFVDTPPDIFIPDVYAAQYIAYSSVNWYAQSFIPSINSLLRSIEIILYNVGSPSPGNTIVELRDDNSNKPGSNVLTSFTIANSDIASSDTSVNLGVDTDISLSGGTRYWIVVHRDNTGGGMRWKYTGANVLANSGFISDNFDSGGSWGAAQTLDLYFGVRFENEPTDIKLAFAPSSSDIAQFVDSNTEAILLTPSALEEHTTYDADTKSFLLTASGSDIAQFVDTAIESLALILSAVEEHTTYDTDIERLALTGNSTDQADFTDASTESLSLVSSGSDILESSDAASEIFTFAPSDTQNFQGTDSDTEKISLVPTSVDTVQFVDQNTEPLKFIPSADEVFVPPGGATYIDANTERLSLIPNSSDLNQGVDVATESFSLSPTSKDIAEFIDAAAKRIAFEILSIEVPEKFDTNTGTIIFAPSADEIHERIIYDTGVEILHLVPQSADQASFADSGTLYLRFNLKALELKKLYDLIGIAFKRFWSKAQETRCSATVPFRRWWFKSRV